MVNVHQIFLFINLFKKIENISLNIMECHDIERLRGEIYDEKYANDIIKLKK